MVDDHTRRSADAAMLPLVASLGPVGVTAAHWLPDRDGGPVVWLQVPTEAARVAVQSYSWVLPQVQAILTRVNVEPEHVLRLRLEVTSAEAEDQLFTE
ncbi:hypothetical protein EUA93_21300 [Nocardioides oleivorans]|uniref:Asp23/Gls24 family envelope stress response protein n=1 Tax=Nocardioides oleivorans TaxID=273676 RepID=A0A4Q2RNE7_9ACTN|nr:hypothetical protein [Nocardioides oleivorans]RYB89936.1 hypothetical protein EUA93_21300 [Nocardioides oleivorans]